MPKFVLDSRGRSGVLRLMAPSTRRESFDRSAGGNVAAKWRSDAFSGKTETVRSTALRIMRCSMGRTLPRRTNAAEIGLLDGISKDAVTLGITQELIEGRHLGRIFLRHRDHHS